MTNIAARKSPSLAKQRRRLTTFLMALALASPLFSNAQAASTNWEYSNPSPFNSSQPAQPNLAQIHVTKALHDALKAYIAYPSAKTKVVVGVLDGRADPNQIDLSGNLANLFVYNGSYNGYDSHATRSVAKYDLPVPWRTSRIFASAPAKSCRASSA